LNWALRTTLEADFCINALNETLGTSQCEIFNTDQGSQFTTHRFTEPLLAKGIQISTGAEIFCRVRGYLATCRKQDVSATLAMTLVFEGKLPEFAL
jgi:transposase InsO family protein